MGLSTDLVRFGLELSLSVAVAGVAAAVGERCWPRTDQIGISIQTSASELQVKTKFPDRRA